MQQATHRSERFVVLRDPQPGDMGWVVQQHGELYWREYGWNADFEALVRTARETGAKRVYVQHRGSGALVRRLKSLGIQAYPESALAAKAPADGRRRGVGRGVAAISRVSSHGDGAHTLP